MRKKSIRTAILIPVGTVLIAGILLMVIAIGYLSSRTAQDLSNQVVSETVGHYAVSVDEHGENALRIAMTAAPLVEQMRSMPDAREAVLNAFTDILENSTGLVGIWTVWEPGTFDGRDAEYRNAPGHDETGRFVPYVYRPVDSVVIEALEGYNDPVDGEYYQGPKSSGKLHFTDPFFYTSHSGDLLLYSIGVPIIENDAVAGVVGVDIDISDLLNQMNATSVMEDGYIFALNPNGIVTTYPDENLLLSHYSETWMGGFQQQIENILSSGGSYQQTIYSPQHRQSLVVSIEGVQISDSAGFWAVCGIVPKATVMKSSWTLIALIAVIGVILIVLVGACMIYILGKNLRTLPVLTDAARLMAAGDVAGVRLSDLDSGDTKNEVVLLQRAFADMVENTKEQVSAIQQIAQGDLSVQVTPKSPNDLLNKALCDMLQENNRTFLDIRKSAETVHTGASQIASGAQVLAQATIEQASSMEQLSSSAEQISSKAAENESIAENTAALTRDIQSIADHGTEKMQQLSSAVQEIHDASKNIGKVIKMIDDIAFQTNILALNAAVEAARAGQHGKGFAVVADEVRNLAGKSANAAQDTGKMIGNSIEKANMGAQIVGEAEQIFTDIVQNIQSSSELVGRIQSASKSQTQAIEQINTGIDQVSQTTQQNSATAEQSAATSEELSSQADLLYGLISRFRLRGQASLNLHASGFSLGSDEYIG